MKNLAFFFLSVLALLACETTSTNSKTPTVQETTTVEFDSALAAKVGADDYGMRPYVIAYLKRGPNRDRDSIEAINLQRAHMNNITRLAEEGKLVLAGPFLDDTDTRGIYVFAVETIEEAAALTATDPAIQAGSLVMELHPWYGSAALMLINELHGKLSREEI